MTPGPRDEAAWVNHIRALFGSSRAEVGPGDDGCVLSPARYSLSTDMLVEGADFERSWAPANAIGYKAMAANLSDLAGMGATPRHLLLTLGWPATLDDGVIEGVVEGARDLCVREGVDLCGGDLTRAPSLIISMTVVGLQEDPPLLRSGGSPGDRLFVSGPLGGAARALARLLAGERLGTFDTAGPPQDSAQRGLDRFFRPPSQTALGRFLAMRRLATCCMDVSDGLARDLGRICEASGCGALVEREALPLDEGLSGLDGEEAVRLALLGGEEQVLLFGVEPSRERELSEAPCPVFPLGWLAGGRSIELLNAGGGREPLAVHGFDHFLA